MTDRMGQRRDPPRQDRPQETDGVVMVAGRLAITPFVLTIDGTFMVPVCRA